MRAGYLSSVTWTPPPGTIGLTYSYGLTACRATLGQILIKETSSYSHAFIVISDREIVEPWPDGARVAALADYEDEYVAFGFMPGLEPSRSARLAAAALSLDGVGHGLRDYAALALYQYGWRSRRVKRRLADPNSLLPAQFVAETYRRAGIELVPGFDPGDITMEDLGALLITSLAWEVRTPCTDFGVRRGGYAR